ncbi:MAG: hypothetical protein CL786_06225 [Chloroflexi bacterium]|nr:hypothetical protein [Chloroflexota bacterium]|tara:strand:+ start:102 stop:458 length:357 start_codon:yes stop_codon:yes gene_type:complete
MKKLSALVFLCCFVLTACGNQAAEEEAKKQAAQERAAQERAIAECVRYNSQRLIDNKYAALKKYSDAQRGLNSALYGYPSGGGSSESELQREAAKSLITYKPMIEQECSKSLTYIWSP